MACRRQPWRVILAAVLPAVPSVIVLACAVPDIPLEGKACPCAPGWRCDWVRNVCVADVAPDGAPADVAAPATDAPRDAAPDDAAESGHDAAAEAAPVDGGHDGEAGCVAETNGQLCYDRGAECGWLDITDSCGTAREVDCGVCVGPGTCGGGGTDHVCGPPGATENLLQNPGFEEAWDHWEYFTTYLGMTCAPAAPGYSGNAAARCLLINKDPDMHLGQMPLTILSETTYQLSFVGRSPQNCDLGVAVIQGGGSYPPYTESKRIQLSGEWQPYSVTLTTKDLGGTVTDGFLMVYFFPDSDIGLVGCGAGATYEFDEFYLAPE
jgi:hypothetical protein